MKGSGRVMLAQIALGFVVLPHSLAWQNTALWRRVSSSFTPRYSSTTVDMPSTPETTSRPKSLEWRPKGYSTWIWRNDVEKMDIKVNYVARGLDKPGW